MRYLLAIVLTTLGLCAFAQNEVMMDGNNPKDAALFLKTENGISSVVNGHGTEIEAHRVFALNINDRIDRGWTQRVERGEERPTTRGVSIGPVFNLTYLDVVNDTKFGFDDPDLGEQRRTALEAAFEYFSNSIDDEGEVDIEIRESFSGSPNSNPFAYSASYYFGSTGFNRSFTQYHIIEGTDPYSNFPDGYIEFNFSPALDYFYSSTEYPGGQQFDFHTIALHEIMHLLGFTSYLDQSGSSAASPGVFTEFDLLLRDLDKKDLITVSGSGSTATVNGPVASLLTNGQVWSELAPNIYAPVYSPQYFTGSSCDHFDNDRGNGQYVMHPSLQRGAAFKVLDVDEVNVLDQLGYQVDVSVATAIEEDEEIDLANTTFDESIGNLYPNPAAVGTGIQININSLIGEEILVIVFDMLGRESYSKVVVQDQPGPVTAIDPYNQIPPGMYIVVGASNDELFNQKLVIK